MRAEYIAHTDIIEAAAIDLVEEMGLRSTRLIIDVSVPMSSVQIAVEQYEKIPVRKKIENNS